MFLYPFNASVPNVKYFECNFVPAHHALVISWRSTSQYILFEVRMVFNLGVQSSEMSGTQHRKRSLGEWREIDDILPEKCLHFYLQWLNNFFEISRNCTRNHLKVRPGWLKADKSGEKILWFKQLASLANSRISQRNKLIVPLGGNLILLDISNFHVDQGLNIQLRVCIKTHIKLLFLCKKVTIEVTLTLHVSIVCFAPPMCFSIQALGGAVVALLREDTYTVKTGLFTAGIFDLSQLEVVGVTN